MPFYHKIFNILIRADAIPLPIDATKTMLLLHLLVVVYLYNAANIL